MGKTAEPSIPDDLRDRLDALLMEYTGCSAKAKSLRGKVQAETAVLRYKMSEMFREANEELEDLARRRKAITDEVTEAWARQFPDITKAVFPSASVCKAARRTVAVKNKRAVIDALDRLDRLDLMEEVINEKGLVKLSRNGDLDDLPAGAVKVTDVPELRVSKRKDVVLDEQDRL